jgi:hypothetical protein
LAKTISTAHSVLYGLPVLPVKRVELFSPDQWESFIEEWLDIKKNEYKSIDRLAGAGDKGRDVVAVLKENNDWHCYQCKHYDNPLMPSQVWIEVGKIVYYSFRGDYTCPNKYYFVAPKGCGTSLSTLLKNPSQLKEELKNNWKQSCEDKITAKNSVVLEDKLLAYFEAFDFSIFDKIPIKTIIDEHKSHSNHLVTFGGGLPMRSEIEESDIPSEIQSNESIYVAQLLGAYGSVDSNNYSNIDEINPPYSDHFKRARIGFHYAEQLRNLYRDSLPLGTFENFQDEIYDGTVNIYENTHSNGYEKVKAVETSATLVVISSNPLKDVSIQKDKIGICHQLSNEKRYKWII